MLVGKCVCVNACVIDRAGARAGLSCFLKKKIKYVFFVACCKCLLKVLSSVLLASAWRAHGERSSENIKIKCA